MEVLVNKSQKPKPGFNIGVVFNKKPVKGDVGLEIEVEGKNLPHHDVTPSPWVYHQDGSLRGEDNGEYVLYKPIPFDEVAPALETLWTKFKELGSVLDDSNRTSVHVHLNCTTFHLNRLTAFMALYYILEEILTEWCGEYRVGNLFCLRAKDAPAVISQIRRFIRSDGTSELKDGLHYAGLNASALQKFGSLEFRTLRGCTDPAVILDWVGILKRLYDLSAEYPDPRTICTGFSGEGPLAFFERILGDQYSVVRNEISLNDSEIRESLYEGIRLAQDICYCRDWAMFMKIEVTTDPFGRDSKKIAKRLMAADHMNESTPQLLNPALIPYTYSVNPPTMTEYFPTSPMFNPYPPDEEEYEPEEEYDPEPYDPEDLEI